MKLSKSIRLSNNTFRAFLLSFLTQLLITVIILGVFALATYPIVVKLHILLTQSGLAYTINQVITLLTDGQSLRINAQQIADYLIQAYDNFVLAYSQTSLTAGSLALTYLSGAIVLFLLRFTNNLVYIPITSYCKDFMDTSSKKHFLWYLLKHFGESCKFSLIHLLSTVWLDIFIIFGSLASLIIFLPLGIITVPLALILCICVYMTRMALYSFWPIEYVNNGYLIKKALKVGMQKVLNCFWSIFCKYVLLMVTFTVVSVVINYVSLLFNINLAIVNIILTLACVYMLYQFKCIALVEYYQLDNRKFFTRRIKLDTTTDVSNIIIE
ncbi:MAG: hypothetical protein PHW00_02770 [Clostridia bacterium]|nr:hypothetical protein [Clostridia bacterium]